jgi:retron-type reverse transcriptase
MWEEVISFRNLIISYHKAAKHKYYRKEVLVFSANLAENILQLQKELRDKTYTVGEYRQNIVYDPKRRVIMALPFRDRIVQHAFNNYIEPLFDKQMIFATYACRKTKGTHAAAQKAQEYSRKYKYYLKLDIHHYFASIDTELLYNTMSKIINDEDCNWLLKTILESNPNAGLPIGNLLSQLSANFNLHYLDFYAKVKLQIHGYVRYMDDVMVFSNSKQALWNYLNLFTKRIAEIGLQFNHKTTVGLVKNGFTYVGYRIWPNNKLVKKISINRMKKKLKAWKNHKMTNAKYFQSLASWSGHVSHSASHTIVNKLLLQTILEQNKRLAILNTTKGRDK